MEEKLVSLKTEVADNSEEPFIVEYDILPADSFHTSNPLCNEFNAEITNVDNQLDELRIKLEELNSKIERLTNHADGFDYAVAVASGVICGMIDAIFVGEMDIKSATENAEKKIAEKVKEKALKEKIEEAVKKAKESAAKREKSFQKKKLIKLKME